MVVLEYSEVWLSGEYGLISVYFAASGLFLFTLLYLKIEDLKNKISYIEVIVCSGRKPQQLRRFQKTGAGFKLRKASCKLPFSDSVLT